MSLAVVALQAASDHKPVLNGVELEKVLTYAGIGAVWSVVGFGNSQAKYGKQKFSLKKSGQTILIGLIAGVIVAMNDQSPTAGNFETAMAVAVPLANQIVNWAKYSGFVPSGSETTSR